MNRFASSASPSRGRRCFLRSAVGVAASSVLARTQSAIPQTQAFLASELAIRAQMKALGQG